MTDEVDNIPDKVAYQVNRRRMCWAALGIVAITTGFLLYDPAAYAQAVSPVMYSMSGLIAVYFGATSWQQAKR